LILVDTTVWIDLFKGKDTVEVCQLENFLETAEGICICGIILTEALQGVKDDKEYARILERFNDFYFLEISRDTYVRAANLFRTLKKKGITIRKPVDCIIAVVAIENDIPLLHKDRDFDKIHQYAGLKVV
jgi:predicted nucleic acid-binding protein